jgi:hypothetical protein
MPKHQGINWRSPVGHAGEVYARKGEVIQCRAGHPVSIVKEDITVGLFLNLLSETPIKCPCGAHVSLAGCLNLG